MRKRFATGIAVALFVISVAGPASAAKPNNHACLGEDFSGYAAGGAGFGGFVAGLASTSQGVGAEVQAHLAGAVPDATLPNSCND
jgi:hypothetical protein